MKTKRVNVETNAYGDNYFTIYLLFVKLTNGYELRYYYLEKSKAEEQAEVHRGYNNVVTACVCEETVWC